MPATATAIRNIRPSTLALSDELSNQVSALLQSALACIANDDSIALDLLQKATRLMRPSDIVSDAGPSQENSRIQLGGLAPWQVKRLKTYVAENIATQISLFEMATLVKLSTSYFSSAFKVSFGISPHNYVVAQRVEFAKHQMRSTDCPLCEIALDCGLADQAHLSRVFRRLTGTTPSAWRRHSAGANLTTAPQTSSAPH